MRYVVWQHFRTPTSIVGSIDAANLTAAADMARAMCNGSFTITAWDVALAEHRLEAALRDIEADRAAYATLTA